MSPRLRLTLFRAWDVLVALAATSTALYVPFYLVLGFVSGKRFVEEEVIVTVVFGIDVFVRFVRRDRPPVAKVHAPPSTPAWRATVLVLDVLAAIPFFLLGGPVLLLLLRLLKLVRVAQMMRFLRSFQIRRASILRLAFFLYWLALSTHSIASGWVALRAAGATGDRWTRYLDAMYWCVTTLTTVGYGDITPQNAIQKVYTMGVMILGVGMYGFIIGNIANILANIDPIRAGYLRRMEELTAFMSHRQLPGGLQQRIGDYFRYIWHHRLEHNEEAILGNLPPSLRTEVALFLRRDLLATAPLFKGVNRDFLRDVALALKPLVFLPGDEIIRAGEVGHSMYFISRGRVEAVSPDGQTVFATLDEGDFFGEVALVFDQPRSASVRALEYCDLYELERELFQQVLTHYPEFAGKIQARARERHGG